MLRLLFNHFRTTSGPARVTPGEPDAYPLSAAEAHYGLGQLAQARADWTISTRPASIDRVSQLVNT